MDVINTLRSAGDFFQHLFNTEGFPPRWLCGTGWHPVTGWFMITSDLLIFSAYLSIPFLIIYFISQRKDMLFSRIFWLFALFIFACGISHLLDVVMFWWPAYRFNALERFLTGIISWGTVLALLSVVPKALQLKTPAELEKEIQERKQAEAQLTELNESLEKMVAERTQALHEKAWELESTNRELEAFSYSVSHDLKAPLRRIDQFHALIRQNPETLSQEDLNFFLQRISVNVHQMTELIDDLLTFSKITRTEIKRVPLNLTEMVERIARELQEQDPQRTVEWHIQPNMQALGDPTLLNSVWQNLLDNAWKYTASNDDAHIEVGYGQEQGIFCFWVKDNGVGFDMAYLHRLFKPFQRLHNRQQFPGTGIGLANVQRIIARHNGRIWAKGGINEGAQFFFTLPPHSLSPSSFSSASSASAPCSQTSEPTVSS